MDMRENQKKVFFQISKPLEDIINEACEKWGFATKAEFFRFCAIQFLSTDAQILSSDEALNNYAKSIREVKASKWLAKRRLY